LLLARLGGLPEVTDSSASSWPALIGTWMERLAGGGRVVETVRAPLLRDSLPSSSREVISNS
jgi:hypothetical protein